MVAKQYGVVAKQYGALALYCVIYNNTNRLTTVFNSESCLQGMVFDLEKGSTLYIDLAKSNSRSKRARTGLLLVGIIFFDLSLLVIYV